MSVYIYICIYVYINRWPCVLLLYKHHSLPAVPTNPVYNRMYSFCYVRYHYEYTHAWRMSCICAMCARLYACMHAYTHTCMYTQSAQPDPKTQQGTEPQAAQGQKPDAVTGDAASALTGAPVCPARPPPPPPPATDGHALDAGMRAQYPKLSAVLWGAGGERGAGRVCWIMKDMYTYV